MPRPPSIVWKPAASILQSIATPEPLRLAIYAHYGIDHDPCPLDGHITGPDGLDRNVPWGKRNYINPPYVKAGIEAFVKRAIEEMTLGNDSFFLMPFRASLLYYHEAMQHCTGIRFLGRNIKFEGYNSPFPQQLVLMEFEHDKPPRFQHDEIGGVMLWQ